MRLLISLVLLFLQKYLTFLRYCNKKQKQIKTLTLFVDDDDEVNNDMCWGLRGSPFISSLQRNADAFVCASLGIFTVTNQYLTCCRTLLWKVVTYISREKVISISRK